MSNDQLSVTTGLFNKFYLISEVSAIKKKKDNLE